MDVFFCHCWKIQSSNQPITHPAYASLSIEEKNRLNIQQNEIYRSSAITLSTDNQTYFNKSKLINENTRK